MNKAPYKKACISIISKFPDFETYPRSQKIIKCLYKYKGIETGGTGTHFVHKIK